MKCNKCKRDVYAVFRSNPKGEKGIFLCEQCLPEKPPQKTKEIVSELYLMGNDIQGELQ